jgi:hypothetical protein
VCENVAAHSKAQVRVCDRTSAAHPARCELGGCERAVVPPLKGTARSPAHWANPNQRNATLRTQRNHPTHLRNPATRSQPPAADIRRGGKRERLR